MSVTPKNTRVHGPTRGAQELIEWAVLEIRELDQLCRSQVPGYDPLHSDDMDRLQALRDLAGTFNAKVAK